MRIKREKTELEQSERDERERESWREAQLG